MGKLKEKEDAINAVIISLWERASVWLHIERFTERERGICHFRASCR